MKLKLLIILTFFVSLLQAQNLSRRTNGTVTVEDPNLFTSRSFRVPVYEDTTQANTLFPTLDSVGKIIYTRLDNKLKYRGVGGWYDVSSSSGIDSLTQTGSTLYAWKNGVSTLHDVTTIVTITPNYNDSLFLVYLNGNLNDSFPSGVKDTYGIGGIRIVDSLGNIYVDGSGISGGGLSSDSVKQLISDSTKLFGKEDNLAHEDRSMDMNGNYFEVYNAKLFAMQADNSVDNSSVFSFGWNDVAHGKIVYVGAVNSSQGSHISISDTGGIKYSKLDNAGVPNGVEKYLPLSVQVNGTEHFANDSGKVDLGTISGGGAGWNLDGNSGLDSAVNFIGTTDEQPIIFKTNNTPSVKFAIGNRFQFGSYSSVTKDEGVAFTGAQAIGLGGFATNIGVARGEYSFAMGDGAGAYGDWSVAMGLSTESRGLQSYTFGEALIAKAAKSFVIGTANDSSDTPNPLVESSTDRLFQIGNGTAFARSNALTLLKNGKLRLHSYGTGAITGTPTYSLNVDASGNIIEGTIGGGGATSIQELWEGHSYYEYEPIIDTRSSYSTYDFYSNHHTWAYPPPFSHGGSLSYRAFSDYGGGYPTLDMDRIYGYSSLGYSIDGSNSANVIIDSSLTINLSTTEKDIRISIDSSNLPQNMLYVDAAGRIWKAAVPSPGTTINFADNEEATGSTSSTITLAHTPTAGSVKMYKNGVRQLLAKFSVTGTTLTLTDSRLSTDSFTLDYRY